MVEEIWLKFQFSGVDRKVWEIYKAYELRAKKQGDYRKYLPYKTDPREGKNWKYFEQTYENFSKDFLFDPYIFIDAQFRNVPKGNTIYPAQLKTKSAIIKYKEHREALKMSDSDSGAKNLIVSLANTYKFIKKWWKRKNLPLDSYKEFFTKIDGEMVSEGMLFCLQGMISKYFMSVSKHFLEEYHKLDPDMKWEVISPNELKSNKITLVLREEAYSFAKEIFNGEIL